MAEFDILIPAAGNGSRMQSEIPKQYLPLLGQPLIRHTIALFCREAAVRHVYVVLAPEDRQFQQYDWQPFADRLRPLYCGGATRAESVRNGLAAMAGAVQPEDWVLVHDAARPCLSGTALRRLLQEAGSDAVGGLLAMPVADTLKQADGSRIGRTLPREGVWAAQTPQMFRHALLLEALQETGGAAPTDEAQAVERLGKAPLLVRGEATNLKVTYPEDLHMAALILRAREQERLEKKT